MRKTHPRHAVEAREPQLEKKSNLLQREMPRRYVVPKRNRTFLSQGEKIEEEGSCHLFQLPGIGAQQSGHSLSPLCHTAGTDGIAATDFFHAFCWDFLPQMHIFHLGERLLGRDRPEVDVQTPFGFLEISLPFCTTQNHEGWKRSLRSPSPTVNPALPWPRLIHVPKCLFNTFNRVLRHAAVSGTWLGISGVLTGVTKRRSYGKKIVFCYCQKHQNQVLA